MKKLLYLCVILIACGEPSEPSRSNELSEPSELSELNEPETIGLQMPNVERLEDLPNVSASTINKYTWIDNYDISTALINRIPVPEGYQRMNASENTFGDWLRHLPLKPYDTKVLLFNGEEKPRQDVHAAIVNIDVGNKDLQQCADAVMRLKAEYHYSRQEYDKIHFNFTSGDKVSFDDWRFGRKPKVKGNSVTFSARTATADNSYANFKQYMNMIFLYAGTYSVSQELKKKDVSDIQIGDVFIVGGFPGHAMIVVDVAKDKKNTGKTIFLLAQSYMPAQNIHIVKNFNAESADLGCWFSTDFSNFLETPEYSFTRNDLKHW